MGKWSVVVKDTEVNEHNGSFTDWKMTLWGECVDPSTQELLPMPKENDDDDHDVMTASPSFVSVNPVASETDLPANPTDHQHRPVNAKPTSTSSQTTTTTPSEFVSASASASASATSIPSETTVGDKESSHFLPHYFPTFGVSKRTQVWIYGAFAIIVLFCAGLGTYFFVQRRKRRRSEREDYEFEVLDDEDVALNGGVGGRKKGRRAGELYDAFAGESDEEGLLDEDDEAGYRDEETAAERGKESRDER